MFTKEEFVYLRRKSNNSAFGNNQEKNYKLGGSTRNEDVLRGLTSEEETRYLPSIIGVSPTNVEWSKATKDYWSNISIAVPEGEGKKLNISMIYNSEQESLADKDNRKGNPVNMNDYIVWRFCQVHGRVANNADLADNSPKIRYYLHNEREVKNQIKATLNTKMEAMKLFLEIRQDKNLCKNILLVLAKDDAALQTRLVEEQDLDINLNFVLENNPNKFIATANDKNLLVKAFIERCVNKGILIRIPNTDAYKTKDDNIIGNTTDAVIAFITSDTGKALKENLKAQLNASE